MIVGGERDHPAPRFGRAIALREPAAEHFGRLAQPIGFDRRRAVEDEVEPAVIGDPRAGAREQPRSEEHTSELQSLMRSSYAVFCMQTKIQTNSMTTDIK